MPEYDFDAVILQKESDSNAVIKVGLETFRSQNDVKCSFASGALKISATVDDEVYSKTINGLTGEHVDVTDIKKSSGSFSVVLKKKKKFSLEDTFFG